MTGLPLRLGSALLVKWGPQPCLGTSNSPVPALYFLFLSHTTRTLISMSSWRWEWVSWWRLAILDTRRHHVHFGCDFQEEPVPGAFHLQSGFRCLPPTHIQVECLSGAAALWFLLPSWCLSSPCGATCASVESLLQVPGEVVWADTGGTQETWQGRGLGSTWPRPRRVDCIGVWAVEQKNCQVALYQSL